MRRIKIYQKQVSDMKEKYEKVIYLPCYSLGGSTLPGYKPVLNLS
jgi:hypothetical protein